MKKETKKRPQTKKHNRKTSEANTNRKKKGKKKWELGEDIYTYTRGD